MGKDDPRDELIRELEGMLIQSMADAEAIAEAAERRRLADLEAQELRLLTDRHQEQRRTAAFVSDASERVQAIRDAVKVTHRAEGDQRLNALETKFSELAGMMQHFTGGPTGPLLSSTITSWIESQEIKGTDPRRVRTLEARIRNFMSFAGDKPAGAYTFSDFQNFANVLVRVPENWSKREETKNLTFAESAEYNESLPERRRSSTLTGASIEANYISPLRRIFRYISAQYKFINPLSAPVAISSKATESVTREPFSVEQLNVWFAAAAREVRPDLKWLPLLGTVTGARVGELVFLQGKDVYEITPGLWVADLTTDLLMLGGKTAERKVKTKLSCRTFALHQVLVETGFVAYAKSRADHQWVFPHAFRSGKGGAVERPADAASKRLNRRLREIGIHKPYEQTFHSSRHTAKDIMSIAKVDERTSDRQTGHAPKTVGRRYGKSQLRVDEVQVLAALPLLEGLDVIVIDEAQDLSVAQVRFLAAVGRGRTDALFFTGDIGQRIFRLPFSWAKLGLDIRGRSTVLKVCYRTSHQIRSLSDRLLLPVVTDQDGITESRRGTISVFDGPEPQVRLFPDEAAEVHAVADWLRDGMTNGFGHEEIALLIRSDGQLTRATLAAEKAGAPVQIILMHDAKGLEYRAVAVMALDEDVLPDPVRLSEVADLADLEAVQETERHLLYVAATRARDRLMLSGVSPGSAFLDDVQGAAG